MCVPGTANPGAPTDPNYCPVLGTGGNANEFKNGNANVIRGIISANAVVFLGVPVDPPGVSNNRIYRITNVRVNATLIGPGDPGTPGQVIALLAVTSSSLNVALNNPTQIAAFVQPGLSTSVRTADDTALLYLLAWGCDSISDWRATM